MGKAPVSVLIPTKDEERNLPSTLASLSWADEIIVYDSFSEDNTVSLARTHGCTIHQRVFDNFADHKNWAIDNINFHNQWVLILDADESVPPELAAEISAICEGSGQYVAYYIARQIWVDGIWLKHAGKYPDYNVRLFRKGRARYERRIVHEHMTADGPIGFLRHHLVHVDQKGTYRYVERHNRYAEMEAVEAFISIHQANGASGVVSGLRSRGFHRRRSLKNWAYRHLPFRSLFVFLYLYIARGGFLMGRAGLKTCVLRMFYEQMITLYLDELKDSFSPVSLKYGAYIKGKLSDVHPAERI